MTESPTSSSYWHTVHLASSSDEFASLQRSFWGHHLVTFSRLITSGFKPRLTWKRLKKKDQDSNRHCFFLPSSRLIYIKETRKEALLRKYRSVKVRLYLLLKIKLECFNLVRFFSLSLSLTFPAVSPSANNSSYDNSSMSTTVSVPSSS